VEMGTLGGVLEREKRAVEDTFGGLER
jgi:hypothetical protein